MYHYMKVVQGSDYEVSFTATDPETQLPLNLTVGYTFVGKIAKTEFDTTFLYEWPVSPMGIVPEVGRLVVRVPGSVSRTWEFERVVYAVQVINSVTGGEVMGIRGPLYVQPTVE